MKKLFSIVLAGLVLTGCDSDSDKDSEARPHNPSVSEIRNLLASANTAYPTEFGFECDGDGENIRGCYIIPSCRRSSDYFSTRTVYGFGSDKITAYMISYDSSNCSGSPTMSYSSAGIWEYTADYDENLAQGELSVELVYYGDGYLFDPNKPQKGITYKANYNTDNNAKLCLSDLLIDPTRPLKFMSTKADPIDYSNCAVAF
ncbi:hypothetical protein GZ77_22365 [Endozoicomonas montiporae]|uniref:Lipoprotein n=2 Tax=Endozoicomonas montiporae TaxID=1027273 RepID=A0A081N096_9GAMM|nr:hypothetical protein [Endozoicomonas montiporae]AMO54322.1 hypothetical protein EZMO1_0049 [Endozoicomonas montiporae CL-33]KEQ11869.1 hypothetical protein GZ77_22365 [Endozoicomonas montiporae]